MKKFMSIFMVGLLMLMLAGCSQNRLQPEKAATTEASTTGETEAVLTTAPVSTTEPVVYETYPETIGTAILVEGEPEKMLMDLFDGGNYVVYIPRDQWILETSLENGRLTDRWVCSFNDMIDFQVISFGNVSVEEAIAQIQQEKPQYQFQDSDPEGFGGLDMENMYFLDAEARSDGNNTFVLLAEYPMEAGDGFAPRIGKMMEHFEIK